MHQAESPTESGAQLDARKRREHPAPRKALAAACLRRAGVFLLVLPLAASPNEPMIVFSVAQVQFAAQAEGTSSEPQTIAVRNAGNTDVTIGSINIEGENSQQFVETHNCPTAPASLSPNRVCQIQVTFQPEVAGDVSATLSVTDNASGSPQSIVLRGHSGTPVPQVMLSPTALSFGSQRVGGPSRVQVVVLTNTGSAKLNINSAIRIDGTARSEFQLQRVHQACPEDSGELAPNAMCSIGVAFTPVSPGAKNAQLIVDDDAAGSPHTVALSGSGT